MEEEEKVDPDFQKGFNEGYTIALYAPKLADMLVKAETDNPRNEGFKAGRQQLLSEKELNKNILPQWLREHRPIPHQEGPNKSKERGRQIDRDDL